MSVIHFLNVKDGDCTWIEHYSGHITVVDVFNASKPAAAQQESLRAFLESKAKSVPSAPGNFNQKAYPVNPIQYLKDFGVSSIFRFILTHPDMDHMGGIKDLFESFSVLNFWDIENNKEIGSFEGSPHSEADWEFYAKLRSGEYKKTKRLTLYYGSTGQFYNRNADGNGGGDGIKILAPGKDLVEEANKNCDYNDCSYVLLYRTNNRKVIFGGDSHDKTWEFILDNYESDVSDIDILIAPHHGRKSGRSYAFLDVLKPKVTYFGNAKSEHLAYDAWNRRDLAHITNNQANCIVTEIDNDIVAIYVTNESFAKAVNSDTYYNNRLKAWFLGEF